MKSFTIATLAGVASANFYEVAYANQVSIEWQPADVQAWAIEWDTRYQPIRNDWAALLEQTASSIEFTAQSAGWQIGDLLQNGTSGSMYTWEEMLQGVGHDAEYIFGNYMTQADEIMAAEEALNQEMLGRAILYLGDAIEIDGEKLSSLCPAFADDWVTLKPAELFSSKNIAKTVAKVSPNAHVAAKVTIDVADMREYFEMSAIKWEEIQATKEAAFWEDYMQVAAWLQDMAQQIEDSSNLKKSPKNMQQNCDWVQVYDDNWGWIYQWECQDMYVPTFWDHAEDTVEEAAKAFMESPAGQWAESKVPAYEDINETYKEAQEEQWFKDVDVITSWYTTQSQMVVGYLTESAMIYKDLQDQRDAAYAAQWETDSAEARELLAAGMAEAKEALKQKEQELKEEVERRVSGLFGEIKDFIEEVEEELAQDGVVLATKHTQSSGGFGYGFAATGLLAAGAYLYYLKKNEKKTEAAFLQNDTEFEKL